jgi:hypothetical protein
MLHLTTIIVGRPGIKQPGGLDTVMHYDAKLRNRAATGAPLLYMVEVLKLLLQASFLRELGLPDPKIMEFASRSRMARIVKHLGGRIASANSDRSQPCV